MRKNSLTTLIDICLHSIEKTSEEEKMQKFLKKRGERIYYVCDRKRKCHNSVSCGSQCTHTSIPEHAYFGKCKDFEDLLSRFTYYDCDIHNDTPLWVEEDIWEEKERC